MKTKEIVKQFKALESKFKISCKKEISPDALNLAVCGAEKLVSRIQDEDWRTTAQKDCGAFRNPTAYGEVAGYCTYFLQRCSVYLSNRQLVTKNKTLAMQFVRDLSFAYAIYRQLNDGHVVGLAMDNEVARLARETFLYFDPRPHIPRSDDLDDQAMRLIHEIANLYRDYYCKPGPTRKGQKPMRDKKPAFKPWLIAKKSSSAQWSLPSVPEWECFLFTDGFSQLIVSDDLRILLKFENAGCRTSAFGTEELVNGMIQVRLWDVPIYQSPFSVPLTVDFQSETLAVDYWGKGRRKWLLDLCDAAPNDFKISAAMLEQFDEMILAAQQNILQEWISTNPMLLPGVIERCCIQRFERIKKESSVMFCSQSFKKFPEQFRTKAVCMAYLESLPSRYEDYVPEHLKADRDIVHAFVKNSLRFRRDPDDHEHIKANCAGFWERLPVEAQNEGNARYFIEKSGTEAFNWLPESLRTDSIRQIAVLKCPEYLDDLAPVFASTAERDAFLERAWPGMLAEITKAIELVGMDTYAEAFNFILQSRKADSIAAVELPILV